MFKLKVETKAVEGSTIFSNNGVIFLVVETTDYDDPELFYGDSAIECFDNYGLTLQDFNNMEILAEDGDIRISFLDA